MKPDMCANMASALPGADEEVAASWRATLAAELATAVRFADVPSLQHLAACYREMGNEEFAFDLATRALRVDAGKRDLLAVLLDSLVRQRALGKLPQAIAIVLAIKDRTAELRRALACAQSELGQVSQAADEWRVLIEKGVSEPADWRHLARFLNRHGDVNGLGQLLIERLGDVQQVSQSPLAQFCLLRSKTDSNVAGTHALLKQIPEQSLGDADLSLGLAIIAFRLGAFRRAEIEAEAALTQKPDWPVAASVHRSSRSFAGHSSGNILRIRPAVVQAVSDCAAKIQMQQYAWGTIRESGALTVEAELEPFAETGERILEAPSPKCAIATFSVLPISEGEPGHQPTHPDPLEVLPYVDWSLPHLMVQRIHTQPIMHAFIGAPGHRDWYWDEVKLESSVTDDRTNHNSARAAALWQCAYQEITERSQEEEL